MKKLILIIPELLCVLSGVAMAHNSNPEIPHGAQIDRPDAQRNSTLPMPAAEPSPATISGGLYRLGNGYLSCPETLPMTNGQPNLRNCNYIKEVR